MSARPSIGAERTYSTAIAEALTGFQALGDSQSCDFGKAPGDSAEFVGFPSKLSELAITASGNFVTGRMPRSSYLSACATEMIHRQRSY
jgi:hypothetical protein